MRATRRHVSTAKRVRKSGSLGLWSPLTDTSLRAAWRRSGKKDSLGDTLASGFDLATWTDTKGAYTLPTVGGTAPTGFTSGSAVTAHPNNAGCIGGSFTLPDDLECTVGVLAQAPATQIAAREYDTMLSFSTVSATNKWLMFCLRRTATPQLFIGFAASNAGAGWSAWRGSTVLTISNWYRWIWVLSGGTTLAMYVNGTLQTNTMDVNTGGPTEGQFLATVSDADDIELMARRTSAGYAEQWGAGKFDQAYWYSSAFNSSKVAALDAFLAAQATGLT